MKGWSFDTKSVSLGPETPWDYDERARELVFGADVVLDMGTGGGERFSRICDGYRGIPVATEGWPPNVPVAAARLAPLGITVLHASGLHLPLADASVDLVLNRHEELEPADVARVLTPEGRVLTQQIGQNHWRELGEFFPQARSGSGDLFQRYKDGFRDAGLALSSAQEHDLDVAYRTLGDVAYMLTAVPWAVPGFDVERDLDALLALEQSHGREEGVVLTHSNFVIEAEK
jgi:SAM-dependent methyltransferase